MIHAGHLLDVKTGHTMNDVWIVIDGDKISRVGTAAVPAANIIELPNATLLLGLIDAHTHITYEPSFGYGVKVAFGTDAAVYPHGLNAHEFAVYVKLGMTPLQAIQTGTVNAADLLGWSDRIGSLEEGKFADIIAVDGDPTKDVTLLQNPVFVMKGGVVYKQQR